MNNDFYRCKGPIRLRYGDLRRVVKLLAEADATQPATQEGGDSLDAQVDRYMSQYETEAKSAQTEGLDFRAMTRSFLTEADDELPADDTGGKLAGDSINMESFVNSIVRLMDNYDSLLEVRNTLLRRAKSFLAKTYDEQTVQAYEKMMREEHGLEDGKTSDEVHADEYQPPAADRAGSGGDGGAPAA